MHAYFSQEVNQEKTLVIDVNTPRVNMSGSDVFSEVKYLAVTNYSGNVTSIASCFLYYCSSLTGLDLSPVKSRLDADSIKYLSRFCGL